MWTATIQKVERHRTELRNPQSKINIVVVSFHSVPVLQDSFHDWIFQKFCIFLSLFVLGADDEI